VTIRRGSLVGAGAIVSKDVNPEMVVVGNPAKEVVHTTKIKNKITGKNAYPWYKSFDRGMPWQGVGYDKWMDEL
jgi:serine acetyltransferase